MVNFRMAVMRALRDEGHELFVVAPDDGARGTLEREGIGFEPWAVQARGTHPVREAGAIARLSAILGRLKPDLCLCYTIKASIYGSFAGPRHGIRTIAMITGLGYSFLAPGLKSAAARFLYRVSLRRASEVWFLNDDDRALFRDKGLIRAGAGFILRGEGVDTEYFAPREPRPDDGRTVFLMISRLFRDKGVGEYLEAARLVRAERPEAVFRLAGAPGDGGPGTIVPAAIGADVEYLGKLDDIRSAIAAADFVALPSYREGVPRSLLEAASMGKPLVATDVPGCRDVAIDDANAVVAEARSVESLRLAFLRALDLSRDEAAAMGRRGRDLIESEFADAAVIAVYKAKIQGA